MNTASKKGLSTPSELKGPNLTWNTISKLTVKIMVILLCMTSCVSGMKFNGVDVSKKHMKAMPKREKRILAASVVVGFAVATHYNIQIKKK